MPPDRVGLLAETNAEGMNQIRDVWVQCGTGDEEIRLSHEDPAAKYTHRCLCKIIVSFDSQRPTRVCKVSLHNWRFLERTIATGKVTGPGGGDVDTRGESLGKSNGWITDRDGGGSVLVLSLFSFICYPGSAFGVQSLTMASNAVLQAGQPP